MISLRWVGVSKDPFRATLGTENTSERRPSRALVFFSSPPVLLQHNKTPLKPRYKKKMTYVSESQSFPPSPPLFLHTSFLLLPLSYALGQRQPTQAATTVTRQPYALSFISILPALPLCGYTFLIYSLSTPPPRMPLLYKT